MSKLRRISSQEARGLLTLSDEESISSFSSEDSTDEELLDYNDDVNDPDYEDSQQVVEPEDNDSDQDENDIHQPSTSTAPPRPRGKILV